VIGTRDNDYILRASTDHGHQVTVLIPLPSVERENYTEVDISNEIRSLMRLNIDIMHKELTSHFD